MVRFVRPRIGGLVIVCGLMVVSHAFADDAKIRIYAAASLTGVMEDISRIGIENGLPTCACVYAASSTLARQIAGGAPADIFISANPGWVKYLIEREDKQLEPRTFTGNRLVIVAPVDRPLAFNFEKNHSLASALGGGWLALADPDHVPAGIYAASALRKLGHWRGLGRRIARAANARAALALVVRKEVRAGMVYESDAHGEPRVRIAATVPKDSHPEIRYVATNVAGTAVSGVYLNFLTSEAVARILAGHGFQPPTYRLHNK